MAISPPPRRDPWRTAWRLATGDIALVVMTLGIAAGLLIAGYLPQMPTSDTPADYAQWLSEAQARFGPATDTLRALGLFGITRSFLFRALLSSLGGWLLLRLIAEAAALRQGFSWARLPLALAYGGGLLLLAGLLISHLWGWRVAGIVLQNGERVSLPGGRQWVARSPEGEAVIHSPGLVTTVESQGPGVRVAATDAGQSLLLHLPDGEPVAELSVPLTEDRYFAIPDARLVVRLSPRPPTEAEPPDRRGEVLVQVYHSPSGMLTAETVIGADTVLRVDGVTLRFTCAPYVRLTAVFNPGLWPSVAGILSLVVGMAGYVLGPYLPRQSAEESGE
ncbi:MAG TPA: hypothetical protein ENK17_07110 [Anaerolineae bacterium]|nr:hypothetical protein [Anaerolineae bacterium]